MVGILNITLFWPLNKKLSTFLLGSSKVVKITGIAKAGRTVSIIVRGSNKLMLEEAARSLHDALCVVRCLVKKRFIIAGGGAPGNLIFYYTTIITNQVTITNYIS